MSELRLNIDDLTKPISLATGEKHRIVLVGAYIGLELVDEDDNPVPKVDYRVSQAEKVWKGVLDDEGKARVTGLSPGPCEIVFPKLDPVEWLPEAVVPTSGRTHRVGNDEHVAAIAAHYGFGSYATIWDHPKNAEIRQVRENPHVLKPGDELFIPDHSKSPATRDSGSWYRFTLKRDPIMLRLKLLSFKGEPLANADCVLTVDGVAHKLKSGEDGVVEMAIPAATRKATLVAGDEHHQLIVGGLDPMDTPSGLAARLRNMGYSVDGDCGVDLDLLRFAIELFQYDHKLPITGEADDQTKSALRKAAGT